MKSKPKKPAKRVGQKKPTMSEGQKNLTVSVEQKKPTMRVDQKKPTMRVNQRERTEDTEEIKKAKKALVRDLNYTYQININRRLMARFIYECSVRKTNSADALREHIRSQLIEWGVNDSELSELKF